MKNLNSLQKSTLKALLFWLIILSAAMAMAQEQSNYKIVGDKVVKVQEPTEAKAEPIKTKLTHNIKGVIYPVYKSVKGSFFILRTSKKTNKEYKQYLKIENLK